ncbi:PAS domain S-box protein [Roseovarius spongiae]|uniref:histidine kinase n=1 Tax=Roseovarius spongiae TaxID=2320272 RepID=A0A3A8AUB5_9RHOB|nr:PAS domain S-box protein [Roseovarius spongiae]RKF14587.1 PAS domain S-box protein [Roseovarius spongiae]
MRRTIEQDSALADFPGVLNALDDEVAVLDASGYIIAANGAWERFRVENGGDPDACSIGSNYLAVCASADGPSSAAAQILPDALAGTLQTGNTFRCEYPCDSPTEKRWFELTANRYQQDGKAYLIVQHRNITKRHVEREEIEQAYINSNAMAALIATTSDAVISYDLDGNIITWNPAAARLYGYGAEEILGRSLETLYPEGWPKRVTYYRDEIIAGRLQDFEATRIAKDGTERDVWISCAPIRNSDGEVIAISNIHRDVTDVRKAERARDLIAHEVIHRAKNMLSVVSAIQRQTARAAETLEDFNQAFGSRLASLSKSTDLLVHNAWTSVSLCDVVTGHLEPFTSVENDRRVTIAGPHIDLQPESVQTIGMAIHELATNSAKYGVLKQRRGQVAISWEVEEGSGLLQFRWLESGSVSESTLSRKGFGHTVLTSHAATMLDTNASYEMNSDGVSWEIKLPPAHFKAR